MPVNTRPKPVTALTGKGSKVISQGSVDGPSHTPDATDHLLNRDWGSHLHPI